MKVILTTDVPKVGNKYDIKDFKDGYAKNVLIAKGLAVLATPGALASLEKKMNEMKKKREDDMKIFEELISKINNKKIEIKAKSNEKGHLFKSVNALDVSKSIKEITGIDVDSNSIIMDHIKELGVHTVSIKKGDKKGYCEVVVIQDKN